MSEEIMNRLILVLAALAIVGVIFFLPGCTTFVPVDIAKPTARLPNECRVGSSEWQELSSPATKKQVARLWIENRRRYRDLRYRHAVCRKFAQQQTE